MPKRYQRRAGKPNSVRGFCDEMTKNNIINSAAKIAAKQSSGEKKKLRSSHNKIQRFVSQSQISYVIV